MQSYWLSLLIFFPVFILILVLWIPGSFKQLFYRILIATSALELMLSCFLFLSFRRSSAAAYGDASHLQFLERYTWIRLDLDNWGVLLIEYFVGLDGLNIALILLSSLVLLAGAICSFYIQSNFKGFTMLYLLLSSAIYGSFLALDFFLFYVFFEFMLLPMFFLIGIWGGVRREYAALKFFIYTLVGSLCILVAMIALFWSTYMPAHTSKELGYIKEISTFDLASAKKIHEEIREKKVPQNRIVHGFDVLAMTDAQNYLVDGLLTPSGSVVNHNWRWWMFLMLLIGFAIKLPSFPFHTWLPDAHVEAPTSISVVLAGILLKIGGYGLLRFAYPIFPEIAYSLAWLIGLVAVISILYAAANALAMNDLKKMVAYSSVSHLGFALLGIASMTVEGVEGAIFQMFSHGILSSLLFISVGVLYERVHSRNIDDFRGLQAIMPVYTACASIVFFASLGLPGFSGFIGEFLSLLGAFQSTVLPKYLAFLAILGIVLGAAYFLWASQRVFLGKLWLRDSTWQPQLTDLKTWEYMLMVVLILISFVAGIFPFLILDTMTDIPSFIKMILKVQ